MLKKNSQSLISKIKKNKIEKLKSKSRIKEIKTMRKNHIVNLKNIWKTKIEKTSSKTTKKKIKSQMDDYFKKGKSKNEQGDIINIKNVHKFFVTGSAYEHVLKGINLSVKQGEIVTIVGQSGSGKSTLINIISGLLQAEEGNIIVDNTELFMLSEHQRTQFRANTLSFVFQSYNLIPSLSARENIKVGENLRSKNRKEIPLKDILKTLNLENQARKYPHELSGGQNQRVSIGRALAKNPKILFADEPTGALDVERGKDVLKLLLDINRKFKTTIVLVTHNPNIPLISDKIFHIKDGKIDKVITNKKRKIISQIKWT